MKDHNEKLLDLPIELARLHVRVGGADYEIRELDGKERDGYLQDLTARLRTGKDGEVQGVKNFAGLQAALLSLCLYKQGEDAPVGKAEIQGWPAKTVTALFEAARTLSALGGEEDEEGGND